MLTRDPPMFIDAAAHFLGLQMKRFVAHPDFAAKQNSDSYLASENIKRETSAEEAEEAEKGMEEMSEVYREKGEKLYLPEN